LHNSHNLLQIDTEVLSRSQSGYSVKLFTHYTRLRMRGAILLTYFLPLSLLQLQKSSQNSKFLF